jgi:hypothetical protein
MDNKQEKEKLKRRQEKEDVNNLIDFNRKISDQK